MFNAAFWSFLDPFWCNSSDPHAEGCLVKPGLAAEVPAMELPVSHHRATAEEPALQSADRFAMKQEPSSSLGRTPPPQHPSAVYSTAQPVSDNASGSRSLLPLCATRACQRCRSAAFVLVSSLELHLASVHGEPLPFADSEWTQSAVSTVLHGAGSDNNSNDQIDRTSSVHDRMRLPVMTHPNKDVPASSLSNSTVNAAQEKPSSSVTKNARKVASASKVKSTTMNSAQEKLSAAVTNDDDKNGAPTSEVNFSLRLESPWFMTDERQNPQSFSVAGGTKGRVCPQCSAVFVRVSHLERHLARAHGGKLFIVVPADTSTLTSKRLAVKRPAGESAASND